jgi:ubiquinone/menaquinone biosynthesis C-methylase UbiE
VSDAAQLFSDGKGYERLMGRWSRLVGEQFIDWLEVPKGLRWVDVGCGNGAFTELLIERCAPATVAAIDPSEGQLAYARTRPGAKQAEFRVGDAQALPYADGSFDTASMALVISFLSDPAKAVAEMARVVRPGGWIGTYMWDFDVAGVPLHPMYKALDALGMKRTDPPGATSSRRQAMQDFWTSAGLQSVETRVIRIPVSYSSFDDFWSSNAVPIGPLGQAISALTADMKEQLRKLVHDQLPISADGSIVYEAVANAVKGRKPG